MIVIVAAEAIFLEQPVSVLAPVGTQVELTCIVAIGYRILWIVAIPGEVPVNTNNKGAIPALNSSKGIQTEISSEKNPQPPLIFSRAVKNNHITVQCIAVNVSNLFQRCPGDNVTMTFYGTSLLLL